MVDMSSMALNISLQDVNTLLKVNAAISEAFATENPSIPWNESPVPLVPIPNDNSTSLKLANTKSDSERANINIAPINITLIDNTRGKHTGLLIASMQFEHFQAFNWSTTLKASGAVNLAVSSMNASSLAWEPFLIGGRDEHERLQPATIEFSMTAAEPKWVPPEGGYPADADQTDPKITVASWCAQSKSDARFCVDGKSKTYWDTGRSYRRKNGRTRWCIFDMGENVAVSMVKFTAKAATFPRLMQFSIGNDPDVASDKWQDFPLIDTQPSQNPRGMREFVSNPTTDPSVGRFVKWVIISCHGDGRVN